jgi:AsmA protein
MRPLKIAAFTLGGVAALLAIGAGYLAATFDAGKLKGALADEVHTRYGRDLTIDGELALTFWPRLALRVEGAKLSERKPEEVFASIDDLVASVEILPLLRGKVTVSDLAFHGLSVNVVRDESGRFNFDDLAGPPATPDGAQDAQGGGDSAVELSVHGVRLSDSRLSFTDRKSGQTIEVSGLSLHTGALGSVMGGAAGAEGQFSLSGPQPAKGAFRFTARYRADLPAGSYVIEEPSFEFQGKAAGFDTLALHAGLGTIELTAKGVVAARAMKLELDGKRGAERVQLSGRMPELQFDASATLPSLHVALEVDGAGRTVDGSLDVSGVAADGADTRIERIALKASGTVGGVRGALDLAASGRWKAAPGEFHWQDLKGGAKAEGGALPQPLEATLAGAGSLRPGKALQASLDVAEADNRLSADVTWPLAGDAPARFSVDASRLDLDRYLAAGGEEAPASAASGAAAAAPPPMDLAWLDGPRVDGRIQAARLSMRGTQLTALDTPLKIDNGRLRIGPHRFQAWGGEVRGDFSLAAAGNVLKLEERMSGVDLRALQKSVSGSERLAGTADLRLALNTGGPDSAAWMQQLAGSGKLAVRNGAVLGFDLLAALKKWRASIVGGKAVAAQAESGAQTVFKTLDASFTIAKGVATNRDLKVDGKGFKLSGEGSYDLPARYIDYTTTVRLDLRGKALEQAGLGGLARAPVPLRVLGPVDAPSFALAPQGMAKQLESAAQETAKEAIEALQRGEDPKAPSLPGLLERMFK